METFEVQEGPCQWGRIQDTSMLSYYVFNKVPTHKGLYNSMLIWFQDMYKKFRGILNKLTPQKFDTLLEKVKTLDINNQKRLEGVIDLVFEKAIDEPNFSEAYAAMCNKLSVLKVWLDLNIEI